LVICAIAIGVVVSSAGAANVCLRATPLACFPHLDFDLGGSVSPRSLPKGKFAPVRFEIDGRVKQGPPVALRDGILIVDKDIDVDVRGLPVCRGGAYDIRRDDGLRWVERACAEAVVGRGRVGVSIGFPEQSPVSVSSRVVLFNGGVRNGAIALHAIAEIRTPAPSLLNATIEVRKPGRGWTARLRVPVIAGGSGAITRFRLNLGRKFTYRGERKSFLSARCPDGVFKLSLPKLLFRNEARIPGVGSQTILKGGLAVPCRPKG
jgi:hypothetical protein